MTFGTHVNNIKRHGASLGELNLEESIKWFSFSILRQIPGLECLSFPTYNEYCRVTSNVSK